MLFRVCVCARVCVCPLNSLKRCYKEKKQSITELMCRSVFKGGHMLCVSISAPLCSSDQSVKLSAVLKLQLHVLFQTKVAGNVFSQRLEDTVPE